MSQACVVEHLTWVPVDLCAPPEGSHVLLQIHHIHTGRNVVVDAVREGCEFLDDDGFPLANARYWAVRVEGPA